MSGLVLVPRTRAMGRRRRRWRPRPLSSPLPGPDQTGEITMAMSLLATSVDGSNIARLALFWAECWTGPLTRAPPQDPPPSIPPATSGSCSTRSRRANRQSQEPPAVGAFSQTCARKRSRRRGCPVKLVRTSAAPPSAAERSASYRIRWRGFASPWPGLAIPGARPGSPCRRCLAATSRFSPSP